MRQHALRSLSWLLTAMEGESAITIADVTLTVKSGPARRVRWDVLRLR